MPGSLLVTSGPQPSRGVARHESTRSDSSSQSSAAGNKKVSFNKAVRVKKYPRPSSNKKAEPQNGDEPANGSGGESAKRFWFRVYKNRHRQQPDPAEHRRRHQNEVIYYGSDGGAADAVSYHPNPSAINYPPALTSDCGTQTPPTVARTALLGNEATPLHPSQMPTDPPHVRRNYVRKIVSKFNEEAVLQQQRSDELDRLSPPGSPRHHSTPKSYVSAAPFPPPPLPPPSGGGRPATTYRHHLQTDRDAQLPPPPVGLFGSRFKRNPIVNGVKVMFGLGQLKKADLAKNGHSGKQRRDPSPPRRHGSGDREDFHHPAGGPPYKTEIIISDGSETEVKSPYLQYGKSRYDDRKYNNNNKDYDDRKYNSNNNEYDDRKYNSNNNELVRVNNGTLDYPRVDDQEEDYRYYFDGDNADDRRKGKYHVEAWDSGNQLVFDTTDVNTASAKTDKGEFISTVGEKHQLWRNNKRVIVYEQPSPTIIRRKAKSHSDLTNQDVQYYEDDILDKGVSTEELFTRKTDKKESLTKKQKDSWLKHLRSSTKDKGIQCNKLPLDEPEELYGFGRYKIIRPRNGIVTAFCNIPSVEKTKSNNHTVSNHTNGYTSKDSAIYSQVDKSKKKKNSFRKKNFFSDEGRLGGLFKSRSEPLYIGPPPKTHHQSEEELDSIYETRGDRKVKTSRRSFGFKLNTGKDEDNARAGKNFYREEDWYNVDGDVEAVERQKRKGVSHRDIAEVRQEIVEEAISEDASSLSNGEQKRNGTAGSVIREVDFKKREISYENVPHGDGESSSQPTVGSGLWYRDADEDYRREMAQNEVSYPSGNNVGSERFYTVDRRDKTKKKNPPPSPRSYTLDRRHMKDQQQKPANNVSGVKILVNGKEINDKASPSGKKFRSRMREDPSSVQSDPLCVRGGLAAAYQARQRNAVRRSNSSSSGLHRTGSPRIRSSRAYHHGSSEISAASSGSDSTRRQRRPLVMYIPGISHQERSSDVDDRSSGVNIARSQSMMTASRPSRVVVKQRSSQHGRGGHKGSKPDLYRNGDLLYEEDDEIMPLASDANRRKPPKVPADSRKQSDIKRRHSMPKDTKFSWLKWKIRGKPSREP